MIPMLMRTSLNVEWTESLFTPTQSEFVICLQMFDTFMKDEDALLRAANAQWAIVPANFAAVGTGPTDEPALLINDDGVMIGRTPECGLALKAASVSC